jgi:membrane protease YdiL (CAAX protease family)
MNVLITILTAVITYGVAAAVTRLIPQPLRDTHPWLSQAVLKPLLIALSLGLMYAMRRPFADFGFRRATGKSKAWIALGVALGAVATMVVLLLGLEGLQKVMKGYTFPMIILWVWLGSSIAEEIFVRGWFQSTLVMRGVAQRPAVILSGALFGAMHLSLLAVGVQAASVAVIVTSTFLLGLVCAHLRATRDSLMPAILAHIGFNVGGMLGGIVVVVTRKLMH